VLARISYKVSMLLVAIGDVFIVDDCGLEAQLFCEDGLELGELRA
jgi:hypothetical protein